jgi:uncharacterized protein YuzE
MAAMNVQDYLHLLPALRGTPQGNVWLHYDEEADVLYVNFKRPGIATDSELTDDDIIVRYNEAGIVGFTVLHASKRTHA